MARTLSLRRGQWDGSSMNCDGIGNVQASPTRVRPPYCLHPQGLLEMIDVGLTADQPAVTAAYGKLERCRAAINGVLDDGGYDAFLSPTGAQPLAPQSTLEPSAGSSACGPSEIHCHAHAWFQHTAMRPFSTRPRGGAHRTAHRKRDILHAVELPRHAVGGGPGAGWALRWAGCP